MKAAIAPSICSQPDESVEARIAAPLELLL
jgi:hypothetical protein